MSVIFISGFETRDFKEWTTTSGTPVINTSIQPTGDACVEMNASTDYVQQDASSLPDWGISVKFRFDVGGSLSSYAVVLGKNSSAVDRLQLRKTTADKLEMVVPFSQTGSQVLLADTWYTLRIVHNYVDGAGGDTIQVYIDAASTPDIENTSASAFNDIDEFRLYGDSRVYFYDDFVLLDTATDPGVRNIVRADPISTDALAPWGSGDEGDIDDWELTADDGDTTMAEITTSSADITADNLDEIAALGIGSGDTINSMKMCHVMKRDGGSGTAHYIRMWDPVNGAERSADLAPPTSHVFYSHMYSKTMLTPTQFDAAQLGAEKSAGGQKYMCTAEAVMVDYTPAGAGDFPLDCAPGTYSLAGVAASLLLGAKLLASPSSYALTGLAATLNRGFALDMDPGAYSLSGVDTTQLLGRVLSANVGGYTTTGVDASLLYGAMLSADPGGLSITGLGASLNFGYVIVTDVGTYLLTGVDTTQLRGLLVNAAPATYSITGIDGSLVVGRVAQVDPGVYTISGVDANLLGPSAILSADPGAYTLAGVAAAALQARLLSANVGSYAVSGLGASLNFGYVIVTDAGTYLLIGVDTTQLLTRMINAAPATYSITGIDGSLVVGRVAQVDPGVYTISGQDAGLLIGRVLSAGPGNYSMVGQSGSLIRGYLLTTDAGTYLLTGVDTTQLRGLLMTVDPGVYTLSGVAATLESVGLDKILVAEPGVYIILGAGADIAREWPYYAGLGLKYADKSQEAEYADSSVGLKYRDKSKEIEQ